VCGRQAARVAGYKRLGSVGKPAKLSGDNSSRARRGNATQAGPQLKLGYTGARTSPVVSLMATPAGRPGLYNRAVKPVLQPAFTGQSAFTEALPFLAVICTGVIGTLVFISLPIFVAGIAGQFGWSEREIGWLAAADMGGTALASLLISVLIARITWKKTIRLAIVCAIGGNLLSMAMASIGTLLLIRLLTGFSNGVMLAVVFVILTRSRHPDRYFGFYVLAQLGLQVVLLPMLPGIIADWGMYAVYMLFAAASASSLLLLRYFPKQPADRPTNVPGEAAPATQQPRAWAFLALAAQGLYFLAPAAIWAYFESIGETFKLSISTVGHALGLASLAGIAGALLVVVLGNRFSRSACMAVGTAVSMAAVWVLLHESGFTWFLLAAALVNLAWNYTFPYQMGTLALFDQHGAVAALSLVVQTFALSLGPMLASFLLADKDFSVILWACQGCYLVSLLMFFLSSYRGAPRQAVLL